MPSRAARTLRKVLEYAMSDLAVADRDTVEQRIAAGQSAEQAEVEFLTDAYFDSWISGYAGSAISGIQKDKRNSSRDQV